MTEKATPAAPKVNVEELQQRIVDLETENRDHVEGSRIARAVLTDYQQQLADAVLTTATYKAQLQVAQQKLSASAAQ